MPQKYTLPTPAELANMLRTGCDLHQWRHAWKGTPVMIAADYLEELAALKVKQASHCDSED